MNTANTIAPEQKQRSREDVFAVSPLNLIANDVCRLMLLLRDKLRNFNEDELRKLLGHKLRDAGLDSALSNEEDLKILAIFEGAAALNGVLPMIHEKIHGQTLPVPRDYDAYWS